jgi:hypothetical protein
MYSVMLRRVEPSSVTARDLSDPPKSERLFGDEEAAAASGMPLPSLRVLQSAGAIRSEKSPKFHGGFRRMWPEGEVLKAAIAAALGEHFAWNIRLVATVMASVHQPLWNTLIAAAADELRRAEPSTLQRSFVVASELDWYAELIDRKFLFLKAPANATDMLPGWTSRRSDLLLGVLDGDTFTGISWELATPRGRKVARETLGEDKARQLELLYKLALVSHGNFLSKASINLSLQARAAWRRLHGMESRFVQETVQLRRRKPDR